MDKQKDGCAKPAAGVISRSARSTNTNDSAVLFEEEDDMVIARVGHEAPDFESTAFFNGEFLNIKLSDYKGKWILLCFYPGDFTFV